MESKNNEDKKSKVEGINLNEINILNNNSNYNEIYKKLKSLQEYIIRNNKKYKKTKDLLEQIKKILNNSNLNILDYYKILKKLENIDIFKKETNKIIELDEKKENNYYIDPNTYDLVIKEKVKNNYEKNNTNIKIIEDKYYIQNLYLKNNLYQDEFNESFSEKHKKIDLNEIYTINKEPSNQKDFNYKIDNNDKYLNKSDFNKNLQDFEIIDISQNSDNKYIEAIKENIEDENKKIKIYLLPHILDDKKKFFKVKFNNINNWCCIGIIKNNKKLDELQKYNNKINFINIETLNNTPNYLITSDNYIFEWNGHETIYNKIKDNDDLYYLQNGVELTFIYSPNNKTFKILIGHKKIYTFESILYNKEVNYKPCFIFDDGSDIPKFEIN